VQQIAVLSRLVEWIRFLIAKAQNYSGLVKDPPEVPEQEIEMNIKMELTWITLQVRKM